MHLKVLCSHVMQTLADQNCCHKRDPLSNRQAAASEDRVKQASYAVFMFITLLFTLDKKNFLSIFSRLLF